MKEVVSDSYLKCLEVNLVCPYCKKGTYDLAQVDDTEGQAKCLNCKKEFKWKLKSN